MLAIYKENPVIYFNPVYIKIFGLAWLHIQVLNHRYPFGKTCYLTGKISWERNEMPSTWVNPYLKCLNAEAWKKLLKLSLEPTLNPDPRYAYSIGLSDLVNFEIIFAGGIIYSKDEVEIIFDAVVDKLKTVKNINDLKIYIENLGVFSLNNVDDSWCKLMMLGVFDYYKVKAILRPLI